MHADEDIVERRGVETVFRGSVGHDAIHLAELVEVTHIGAAAIGAQRAEHDSGRNAGTVALRCIDLDLIFREAFRVGGHRQHDFRPFVEFRKEFVGIGIEIRHGAVLHVLQHQVHAVV